MLSNDELIFYKPLNTTEYTFYTQIQSTINQEEPIDKDTDSVNIGMFLAPCYGKLNSNQSESANQMKEEDPILTSTIGEDYLVLANIIYGYRLPIIIDVKLGSQLYDPEDTNDIKKQRMIKVSQETTSGPLGFRICGVKIGLKELLDDDTDLDNLDEGNLLTKYLKPIENVRYEKCAYIERNILSLNKHFGRSLNEKTIAKGFEIIFRGNDLPKEVQDEVINMFIIRLGIFYNSLMDIECRAYSSSLLFVFEGDKDRWQEENSHEVIVTYDDEDEDTDEEEVNESLLQNITQAHGINMVNMEDIMKSYKKGEEEKPIPDRKAPLSDMKWIDFAHTKLKPGKGYDTNLLDGVESLIKILEQQLL